jgi:hypothetical protein
MPIHGASSPRSLPAHYRDFVTADQATAYASGDEDAIDAADVCALYDGIQASLAEAKGATRNTSDAINPLQKQQELSESAQADLERQGYSIIRTRGCSPNCLLVALLQHKLGKYVESLSSSLLTKVNEWRNKLVEESKKWDTSGEQSIGPNDKLDADHPLIPWLVKSILGDDTRVEFYCADANGKAINHKSIGDGDRTVKIFDCGGSFKAMIRDPQHPNKCPDGSVRWA